MFFQAGRLNG